MKNTMAILLAAGKGERMKSELAKVLHPIAGRPMIMYTLDTLAALGLAKVVIVVGHQKEKVQQAITERLRSGKLQLEYVEQDKQLGTGHAVLQCQRYLKSWKGNVLVLSGDVPLISRDALRTLQRSHAKAEAAASVLSMQLDRPGVYGRIVRDDEGAFQQIIEYRDAKPKQREIDEVNTGIYMFQGRYLFNGIKKLESNFKKGKGKAKEFYLTDMIALAVERGLPAQALCLDDAAEGLGVNSRSDLASAQRVMRNQINNGHMERGVSIRDPFTTFIDADVRIGQDSVIEPVVHLRGNTRIGKGTKVMLGSYIENSTVGNDARIRPHSVIEEASVGHGCSVGPNAHLRPGADMAAGSSVGNYVEIKKSKIGAGSKVNHMSYIGDANIGQNVNIGAGTITCNYDGLGKYQTLVEDEAFIGSDCQLVAPIKIHRGAYVGSGSTITHDVPAGALSMTRARQETKEGWVDRWRKLRIVRQQKIEQGEQAKQEEDEKKPAPDKKS
ncbi:MAG: bifunctional UDP-N-acetylglucosamine diphosphorylase/glucosamine-1-phosphate N-acetyltransferase GlmU [Candidatus Alcyoniella australis]|nr:bifunctional UDP-N-acetylglucosamine diphosphorylase/glucosamine-1-phosphate N-acetyltransferase GlmU [Candidatus Alcyoniella australis]